MRCTLSLWSWRCLRSDAALWGNANVDTVELTARLHTRPRGGGSNLDFWGRSCFRAVEIASGRSSLLLQGRVPFGAVDSAFGRSEMFHGDQTFTTPHTTSTLPCLARLQDLWAYARVLLEALLTTPDGQYGPDGRRQQTESWSPAWTSKRRCDHRRHARNTRNG